MKLLSQLTPLRAQTSMWDPLRELSSMENRLERFFNAPFSRGVLSNGEKEAMTVTQWAPLVDISEDDKEYLVRAELPDLKKEDVNVTVENGELTITGERKLEKEEKGRKFHRIERSYGSCMRSFTLPEGVSAEKACADFRDGVLEVHLPKDEKAKPKAIAIKVQ